MKTTRTKCVCIQVLRSHSWQWVQEVHGEDASTHVPLCDLQHSTKTNGWWRKAQLCQDYNFLCHKNSRYLFNLRNNIWICIEIYNTSDKFISPWIPKDHFFSPETQVLQPLERKRSQHLIWRRVFLVPSPTNLIQVKKQLFNLSTSLKSSISKQWDTDVCFCFFKKKGKLKPFGETIENTAGNKSLISGSSHQKNYKQHQVQTRYM